MWGRDSIYSIKKSFSKLIIINQNNISKLLFNIFLSISIVNPIVSIWSSLHLQQPHVSFSTLDLLLLSPSPLAYDNTSFFKRRNSLFLVGRDLRKSRPPKYEFLNGIELGLFERSGRAYLTDRRNAVNFLKYYFCIKNHPKFNELLYIDYSDHEKIFCDG